MILDHFALSHICDNCPVRVKELKAAAAMFATYVPTKCCVHHYAHAQVVLICVR